MARSYAELNTLDCSKALLFWIRNNWRLDSQERQVKLNVKRTDVLWSQHRETVLSEIASLMGTETIDTSTRGWFGKRMTAMGNIIARMSDAERKELDLEVEKFASTGYPESTHIQYVYPPAPYVPANFS